MKTAKNTMIIKKIQHGGGGRYGFTLAEAMLAMVILGMAAAGVLLPFSSGASVQAEGMHSTLAAKLASNLMEQVINTPFNQITTSYNYSESQGQLEGLYGEILTDSAHQNFSRTVSSEYVDVPISPGVYSSDVEYILVTVQVNYSGREMATLTRLISE